MSAKDYREIARDNLSGNWKINILVTLVAGLLGGVFANYGPQLLISIDEATVQEFGFTFTPALRTYAAIVSFLPIVIFLVSGSVKLGYSQFLLKQYDFGSGSMKDLFSQFYRFSDGFCLMLLTLVFTYLWSLLFVIPGIIASYRYAMAPFIMAENPDMTATEAIRASKAFMKGRKAALFCLDLSFLGWGLLNILTLGIGGLWLTPYVNSAYAAFYRGKSW